MSLSDWIPGIKKSKKGGWKGGASKQKTGLIIGTQTKKNPRVVEAWKEMEKRLGNDPHDVITYLIEKRLENEGKEIPLRGKGPEDKLATIMEEVRMVAVDGIGKQVHDGIQDITEMEKSKAELLQDIEELGKRKREEERYVEETVRSADVVEDKVKAKEKRLKMLEDRVIEQTEMLDNLRIEYDALLRQQLSGPPVAKRFVPAQTVSPVLPANQATTPEPEKTKKVDQINYRRPRGRRKK